ncbi:MAG: peptidyl-prolyl cis-trans isomerase C [Litorivivens sp.]
MVYAITRLKQLFREPLFYFLLVGSLLFLLDESMPQSDQTITVSKRELLNFLQLQSTSGDRDVALKMFAEMDPENLSLLIRNFTEEEALYRTGIKLGVDESDYVIRKRIIQKMEYIGDGFKPEVDNPQSFFERHQDRYLVEEKITFTHVFINNGADAEARTSLLLTELNQSAADYSAATSYGDRFLYHTNNVDRTLGEVADHFGNRMAKALFTLNPDNSLWRGGFRSSGGHHIVLLTSRTPARIPAFKEIEARVRADARSEQIREARAQFVQRTVSEFTVEIAPELASQVLKNL